MSIEDLQKLANMGSNAGVGKSSADELGVPVRSEGRKSGVGVNLKVLAAAGPQMTTAMREMRSILPAQGRVKLVEIYDSVKGEGTQAGVPMTFVRFSKCNLACDFCDTPYDRVAIEMSIEELLVNIKTRDPAWVIFTGGEPCLQLCPLITRPLKDAGVRMAIETNGMVWTDSFYDLDYINISPKTCYDVPGNPIPVDKILAMKLKEEVNAGKIRIHEMRSIICGVKDDIVDPLKIGLNKDPDFITISPLMHDAEPSESFISGRGHHSIYGIIDQVAMNRCMNLVQKYRHRNARLSVQVHKFVGVR